MAITTRSLIALLSASALSNMVAAAPSLMDGDTAEGHGQTECAMDCYKDWLHGVDDWGCLPDKSFLSLYFHSGDLGTFAQCLCTDKVAMKGVTQCVVDTCPTQASINSSFSGAYGACGTYNVHLPPPDELVTELEVTVPSTVTIPSSIPGIIYGENIPSLEDIKSKKTLATYSGNQTHVHHNTTSLQNSTTSTNGTHPVTEDEELSSAAGRSASPKSLVLVMALMVVLLVNMASASALPADFEIGTDASNSYGVEWSAEDQAPDCSSACMGNIEEDIPQCIVDAMGSGWTSTKIQNIWSGNNTNAIEQFDKASECLCTDKNYVEQLVTCMFKNCASSNTDIYSATSFGYKACAVQYNVLFPSPPDVVKILNITVPKGVVVPTTITGVPEATAWPSAGSTANASSSASASATGPPTVTVTVYGSPTSSSNSGNQTGAISMLGSAAINGPSSSLALASALIIGAVFLMFAA
ncbi:hypothetical protein RUND412_008256 [Rhizina undulata]